MNHWQTQEEKYLKHLKEDQKIISWAAIAAKVNQQFGHNEKNGKQCRERYINFLKPGLSEPHSKVWAPEEDQIMYEKYQQYGPRWTLLSEFLPFKSQNSIKNRFYGNLRKFARKLNKIGKQHMKLKKMLKYESVVKPLEAKYAEDSPGLSKLTNLGNTFSILIEVLSHQILTVLKQNQSEVNPQTGIEIIKKINKFNLQTRSLKFNKKKHPRNAMMITKSTQCSSYENENEDQEEFEGNNEEPGIQEVEASHIQGNQQPKVQDNDEKNEIDGIQLQKQASNSLEEQLNNLNYIFEPIDKYLTF